MRAVLDAVSLSKSFGGNRAVVDVGFSLQEAELVALVGPNGAGKSTLLNLLTNQEHPDGGSVFIKGVDVTRKPPSHRTRRRLNRSYQDAGIFLRLSAVENVMIPALARGVRRGHAEHAARGALERVGLERVLHERADRLSGGQRKLIDFARSLVTNASVTLYDEPTAGVHPALAELMATIITTQRRAGVAALIVSHDLHWVLEICERVIVLATGEMLADGTPDAIRKNRAVQEAYLS